MFWMAFFVALAISVVGELIRPKQSPPNAEASALDDFDMPTAESGRILTVFCGKVKITGANVTYYGGLSTKALTKKVKTGMFSSKRQTYAHEYRMTIEHVLGFGGPDVKLHNVFFDELSPRRTVFTDADGTSRWAIDDESLFGGKEQEGGVSGTLRFYPGNELHFPNVTIAALVGEEVPTYPDLCRVVLENFYVGTSKYIKPVAFEVSRYPNQLGLADNEHVIGEDANPVCFIYEVLTNKKWGVGKPSSAIDIEGFRAAAQTVHGEGLGMSMIYNGSATAEDVIADLLRHIDGVMYSDPQTGLITLKLARADYVVADLPVFGEDDFIEAPTFSRPSWSETKNTMIVSFTDRANGYVVTPVNFQDQANIMQRAGEITSETVDFSGFTTRDAITEAGLRVLKAGAWPLANLSGRLTRRAWRLRPGAVIVIDWPGLGINKIVFRVTAVGYGNIKQNSITFSATEDVFDLGARAYDPPPRSDWVNPAQPPSPVARQWLVEAPYFLTESDDSRLIAFASQSGPLDTGVEVQFGLSTGALATVNESEDFAASALLSSSLSRWGSSATAGSWLNPDEITLAPSAADVATGESLVLVRSSTSEEWMSYTGVSLTTGAITGLKRGLFDTVPQAHPSGAQVWFVPTGFMPVNDAPIGSFPTTAYARLLPYSALGRVEESAATTMSAVANQRSKRPYPPGKVRVNGARPDTLVSTVTSPFTLSWAHRSRLAEGAVDQDANSVQPEEGTTYTVRLKNGTTLLLEKAGIDPSASSASVSSTHTGDLTVEVFAVRQGLASHQLQSYTFAHTGGAGDSIAADEAAYVLDGGAP